jgi:hypothetical protein
MKKLFSLYIALLLFITPALSQEYKLKVASLNAFPNVIFDGTSYSFLLPVLNISNQTIAAGQNINLMISINNDAATILTSFSTTHNLAANDSVLIPITNYQFESARFGGGGGPVTDITIWPTVMNVKGDTSEIGVTFINAAAFSVQNKTVKGLPTYLSVYKRYSVDILTQNVGITDNQNDIDFYARIDSFPVALLASTNQKVPVGGVAQTNVSSFQLSLIFPNILANMNLQNETHFLQIWAIERGKNNAVNRAFFQIQSEVLPVALTEFKGTAVPESNKIDINWITNSEDGNAEFHVEKFNYNLGGFDEIGIIQGGGTSNLKKEYLVTDNHPNAGVNRYRLVQYDLDGSHSIPNKNDLVVNYLSDKSLNVVTTAPNPFSDVLNLRIFNGINRKIFIQIYDIQGKSIYNSTLENQVGTIDISIPTADFPNGIYIYEISNGDEKYTHKIVKE